jgi:hypothetical protein
MKIIWSRSRTGALDQSSDGCPMVADWRVDPDLVTSFQQAELVTITVDMVEDEGGHRTRREYVRKAEETRHA